MGNLKKSTCHLFITALFTFQDLVKESQAAAGLILAAHPEVTNGGPWWPILRHVLQSRLPGGRCVFATFYRQEAEADSSLMSGILTENRFGDPGMKLF